MPGWPSSTVSNRFAKVNQSQLGFARCCPDHSPLLCLALGAAVVRSAWRSWACRLRSSARSYQRVACRRARESCSRRRFFSAAASRRASSRSRPTIRRGFDRRPRVMPTCTPSLPRRARRATPCAIWSQSRFGRRGRSSHSPGAPLLPRSRQADAAGDPASRVVLSGQRRSPNVIASGAAVTCRVLARLVPGRGGGAHGQTGGGAVSVVMLAAVWSLVRCVRP